MATNLFRSNSTSLSDNELLILDVIFDGGATPSMLRQQHFVEQWSAPSHSLSDDELKSTLRRLLKSDVLESRSHSSGRYVAMTPAGGKLWSAERCPVWNRYCTDRYPAVIRDRVIMSVTAVAASVRDDFLRLWPENRARLKRVTIRDPGMIAWHPFPNVHVGLASYADQPDSMSPDEYHLWVDKHRAHIERVESERTWWRTVRELQKFVDV